MTGLFYHDVLAAFQEAGVSMVVVGAVALNLHGVQRSTSDLDLAISLDATSLPRAVDLVQRLGMRCRLPEPASRLSDPEVVRGWVEERNLIALKFTDPVDPLREVDLLVAPPVPFEELLRGATRLEAGGLSFLVAGVDDLIRMKTGTGRAIDEDDVADLRRLQELAGER